jgi:hypothetical protein
MCSFYVGKDARQVWKKPFRHSNDFQLHLGKHLYSFDSTGCITIYDFWTGRCLLEGVAPKVILGVHGFDGALVVVTKDSFSVFDNSLYQWTHSIKHSISKSFFGCAEALIVYGSGTSVILNLNNHTEYDISNNNNCKIQDAKFFDTHFACLLHNGKIAVIDCFGQQTLNLPLITNLPKIVNFDENSICLSDDRKLMGYSLTGNDNVWSTDCSDITAFEQSIGVLCIGQSDGLVFFIESTNGRIFAVFQGTSQTVSITSHKDLWILGFEDGNIFALSLNI